MDWPFALHYIAFTGCALGFLFTGSRAALVLIAYNMVAFGWYYWTGEGTPVWFRAGDIVATGLILTLCPWTARNVLIAALFGLCFAFYGTDAEGIATRIISIVQFVLCWPFVAAEWDQWLKEKVRNRAIAKVSR